MAKKTAVEKILEQWRQNIKGKIRRIISFEESIQQRIEFLKQYIFPETEPLDDWQYRRFNYTHKRRRIFIDEDWKPIKVGENWGGPDISAYFRRKAQIPTRFKGKKVVLKIYFGGDSLLYLNDRPYHGLDPFRDTVLLTNCAKGNETYDFKIESYIMWHFGEDEVKPFECAYLATMDQQINDAYWDLRAAFDVMIAQGQPPELVDFLKAGLHQATRHIDQNEQSYEAVKDMALQAQKIVRHEIYDTDIFRKNGLIHLCGNSHLDVVFLWTHAEFVRKLGRTHATALRLMEQYPHYKFSQSQPLMYQEMKDNYPILYEQVKQRVKEKRWEVIGAFWVEPDCNLISGESFVRQILHGVDFIEREFGLTPKTAWIPDVFGNAWTMPQILVKSGLKYFVTHKMAFWNDTNKWTKNAFWWQGPDGSRIFATVPPTHFIGTVEPEHLKEHWDGFSEQTTIGETLYAYGWGDGGGGPDPSMLEYAKRYENFPGMVPAKTSTIEQCLEQMERKARQTNLPVINDELYLEEHRGVHTTKAKLKKLNRTCEILYRKAEIFSCFSDAEYPYEELDKGWKQVLTNQFHDSLPGTHVQRVYQDLLQSYELATDIGRRVLQTALEDIASRVDTRGRGQALIVFNSLPFTRSSIARLEYPEKQVHILDANGSEVPHQFISDHETAKTLLIFPANDLPPVGCKLYRIVQGKPGKSHPTVKVSPTTLENDYLKVTINSRGEIVSLLDKQTNRDSIHPEKHANVMKLYQDIPGTYEAWDIEPRYTDLEFDISEASVEVIEQGPVRSAIQVTRNFQNSRMVQRIVLTATANRLDFETYVDWHEQQKLLKTRFYTTIVTRKATYDIAFGNIERPTTRNNPYEAAMFEVPAHMWMDVSQADYGLSLLNDCKYGHEAYGDMFSLSLLKGPKWPDPTSDQEQHWFTYSLYPHAQSWREAKTIRQALDINDPVDVLLCDSHQGRLPAEHSFITINSDNVILEAVKRAEKSDDLIIRLAERHGSQCEVNVNFDRPIKKASECNLLERQDAPAEFDEQKLSFVVRPYEIRTFKVKLT